MKFGSILLVACLLVILLAFGAVWVVTNIFAILKVVLPLAVLAGMVAGMRLGYLMGKAKYCKGRA